MSKKVLSFFISGGIGALSNIVILILCTDFFHLWYLLSSMIAFGISTMISFILQKRITFKDFANEGVYNKFFIFTLIALFNLAINTTFVYLFTDIMDIYYVISQVFSSLIIAGWSFFIYRRIFV
jgi:putative flippase GtrA